MYHEAKGHPVTRDITVLYSQAREFLQYGLDEYSEYINQITQCLAYCDLTEEAKIVDMPYETPEFYFETRRATPSRMESVYADFTDEERLQNFWGDAHQE
jgi:hypothetical protein